jgi:hypothetical protein
MEIGDLFVLGSHGFDRVTRVDGTYTIDVSLVEGMPPAMS